MGNGQGASGKGQAASGNGQWANTKIGYDNQGMAGNWKMNKSLLEKFRKAYQDLELFPLITARQIEAFRVDVANETIARLEVV
ncbi:hypothetical protein [Nostoc sp. CCY 9925]|uniref:hypothetical protein n=1 Tax=Nostoc sp. CCY 9925 TaxID=3103865 RepID=UPI0039C6F742